MKGVITYFKVHYFILTFKHIFYNLFKLMEIVIENNNEVPKKRIILRLVSSKLIYSVPIPITWTAGKLRSFIQISFKDQLKDVSALTLFFEGKKLADEFSLHTIMSELESESTTYPQILVFSQNNHNNVIHNHRQSDQSPNVNHIVIFYLKF
jgi:hypothetical protein